MLLSWGQRGGLRVSFCPPFLGRFLLVLSLANDVLLDLESERGHLVKERHSGHWCSFYKEYLL